MAAPEKLRASEQTRSAIRYIFSWEKRGDSDNFAVAHALEIVPVQKPVFSCSSYECEGVGPPQSEAKSVSLHLSCNKPSLVFDFPTSTYASPRDREYVVP